MWQIDGFSGHGDEEASHSLAEQVRTEMGWNVSVPEYHEAVDLD